MGVSDTIPIEITLSPSHGGGLERTDLGIHYAIVASLEVGEAESIDIYESVRVALAAARAEEEVRNF